MAKKVRWHDQNPKVSELVARWLHLDSSLQEIFATAFIQVAERDFRAQDLITNHTALPPSKLFGLEQSKKRLRKYDRILPNNTAMNYLYIMDDVSRRAIAESLLGLLILIEAYVHNSQFMKRTVAGEKIKQLAETFVGEGPQAADRMLYQLIRENKMEGPMEGQAPAKERTTRKNDKKKPSGGLGGLFQKKPKIDS